MLVNDSKDDYGQPRRVIEEQTARSHAEISFARENFIDYVDFRTAGDDLNVEADFIKVTISWAA